MNVLHSRTASIVTCLLLSVISIFGQQGRKPVPSPGSIEGSRLEIYKRVGDTSLLIHIFEPKNFKSSDSRPAILFFFGGGWRNGTPTQFQHQCAYLASRGMVAMTADYRVANRHGTKAVSCVRDAKSALRWVRKNAKRLGIDPNRVAAGGGSAGGHLAGALGTIGEFDEETEDLSISSVPNALVMFNPALVLSSVKGVRTMDPEKLKSMGERMGVNPEKLSPYHNIVKSMPPSLILHGKADTTVPYRTAEVFAEKAKELGNRCELIGYENQSHGFFNYGRRGGNMFKVTVMEMDRFLVSLGYLEGENTVDDYLKK
ncbi:MAG TPA: alpha/beta hydrolase [Verrucomicrobiales bacterium]|nr:alpha/beta hydrolase [Verrucomicrobiales bacterium]HIL69069.1 alpha/beta hydrolase [Verrucomicrobiota bacterium]